MDRGAWRRRAADWAALVCLAMCIAGCSGSSSFTLFPTGDFLLKSTRFVRRPVPRSLPVPRELEKTVLPQYILQPGDVLIVEPTTLDSPLRFPADQTILADGTIDLGRYGRLVVAGKTIEQIETDVTATVRSVEPGPIDPINVRLINPTSAVYYVLGEVSSPGSYPLIGRETVLDAILQAGGLSDRASPCNIVLSRPSLPDGCRTVLPVCYRQIAQLGDTSTNYQVMPGDRIYVATRTLGEACFNKRPCPMCEGRQCPCPAAQAVSPSLPTIIPPRFNVGEAAPASELIQAPPTTSVEDMPPAPATGSPPYTVEE